jgi:hypothetical protein
VLSVLTELAVLTEFAVPSEFAVLTELDVPTELSVKGDLCVRLNEASARGGLSLVKLALNSSGIDFTVGF